MTTTTWHQQVAVLELNQPERRNALGSPQEVIDKTPTFREHFGDYQRQLFLVDHARLPLETELDLLGAEVVPLLRKEFARQTSTTVCGPFADCCPGTQRLPCPRSARSRRRFRCALGAPARPPRRRARHRLWSAPGR